MNVSKNWDNGVLTVSVDGEINTLTTPTLASAVEDLNGVRTLIFDLDLVPYVSSAGLRLFLSCQRTMQASGGEMQIIHINELMAEIFESVGYDRIMNLAVKKEVEEVHG